ncbi:CRISPR-associated endonuclease Cas2 [Methanobrevibacter oralis]|uniref:CRISPR-associated endoribonuclease Cas2 n=1 Tax=Methanobrevibacter oralis TaxID=66851 RepID=A0A166AQB3_METOA|nr:CRISPR-associated endonuclease Cas2 [Methanobrevibacter oralis]KZX12338.1 CRISPR-associated endoribonuclease Cas2 [Methanobrevibacter oralis]
MKNRNIFLKSLNNLTKNIIYNKTNQYSIMLIIATFDIKFKTNQEKIEQILQHFGLRKIQNTTYTGDLTKIELKDNINENIKEKDNILLIPLCKKCYSNKTVHKRNISFKEDYIGCF